MSWLNAFIQVILHSVADHSYILPLLNSPSPLFCRLMFWTEGWGLSFPKLVDGKKYPMLCISHKLLVQETMYSTIEKIWPSIGQSPLSDTICWDWHFVNIMGLLANCRMFTPMDCEISVLQICALRGKPAGSCLNKHTWRAPCGALHSPRLLGQHPLC